MIRQYLPNKTKIVLFIGLKFFQHLNVALLCEAPKIGSTSTSQQVIGDPMHLENTNDIGAVHCSAVLLTWPYYVGSIWSLDWSASTCHAGPERVETWLVI
jgi:hypothetical protein